MKENELACYSMSLTMHEFVLRKLIYSTITSLTSGRNVNKKVNSIAFYFIMNSTADTAKNC
jgi:hypothetical protein